MAVIARVGDTLTLMQLRLRAATDTAAAAVIWLAIGTLFIWAAFAETQLLVIGLVVGAVLALGAIGLTLIFGILRFANFAHGDTMMLGGYLTFMFLTGAIVGERQDIDLGFGLDGLPGATNAFGDLSFGYGFVLAILLSALVIGAFSIGLDRVVYRPLRRRAAGVVTFAIASLGIAFSVRALMFMFWGPNPRSYVGGIHRAQEYPFDITLKTDELFMFALAVALAAAVYVLLYYTKPGKAMRAMADNPDLASVTGIDTEAIIRWTWVVGGALMAAAGTMLALRSTLKPDLGFALVLPLFASAILGGIGKPHGAIIGAMVVAVSQEVSVAFFPSGYKPGVAFVILILILLLRPRGLFGPSR